MSGFVNDSHSDLIANIKLAIIGRKPRVTAVYSAFNLKILLFLAARGFISSIKVRNVGPGAVIEFSLVTAESGQLAINDIWVPNKKRGRTNNRAVRYRGWRALLSLYTSEFVVVSTNRGLMTALEAASLRVGGSVVCVIS